MTQKGLFSSGVGPYIGCTIYRCICFCNTVEWTGSNVKEVLDFMGWRNASHDEQRGLRIHTIEGMRNASPGDWIIKGVHGEFYPCKPDIFVKTYEPAEEPASSTPTKPPNL